MRCSFSALLLGLVLCGSAMADFFRSPLYSGMPLDEVVQVLGAPQYERLERNGVRCLAYRTRAENPHLAKFVWPRDGFVVALRHGRVFGNEDVLYSEISESCSRFADNLDPPPVDYTCFRKFWTGC